MNNFQKLAAIAVVLWVGSLWAIGFIAAPTLFSALSDRQLAGMLAGRMFTVTAYLGMACGVYLLLYRLIAHGAAALRQLVFWVVLAMLGLTLVGHFGIQPILEGLKLKGGPADVMHGVVADRFARWHGIASVLFVIQSLLGLVLVLRSR
ncbi:DUF4149 domain-containing protein [Thiobacter aerophilum]|uniref:DUF4149 domain-containing protein n=1 Tax=Thiobacter aerophilum TaxID=3121275 RepID=A0ABV0EH32_9BURK